MTAQPGHNLGPQSDADALRARLAEANEKLLSRADELLAAEGRLPAIDGDDGAGKASDYIKQVTACAKALDTARVGAKEPFLEGGRTVDGYFKKIADPLLGLKQRVDRKLSEYLRAKADAERRAREEEARIQREEAGKREAEALAAMATAAPAAAEIATDAAIASQATAAQAQKAAEAKPAELSRTRGDFGAVASLRTEWTGEILDRDTLDLAALRQHIPLDALERAVRAFVKAGGRELAGAKIYERSTAVVR